MAVIAEGQITLASVESGRTVSAYKRTADSTTPATPTSTDSFPTGWTAAPSGVNKDYPFEFITQSLLVGDTYGTWSTPAVYAVYTAARTVSIYKLASTNTAPATPTGGGTSIPSGWSATIPAFTTNNPYVFISQATLEGNTYGTWSTPVLYTYDPTNDDVIFSVLTDNGNKVGIFSSGTVSGSTKLFVNADYIKTGKLVVKDARDNIVFEADIDSKNVDLAGWIAAYGKFYSGSDNTYVELNSNSSDSQALLAGGTTANTAKFIVNKDGTMKAVSAELYSPNKTGKLKVGTEGLELVAKENGTNITKAALSIYDDSQQTATVYPFMRLGAGAGTGSSGAGMIKKYRNSLWIGENSGEDASGNYPGTDGSAPVDVSSSYPYLTGLLVDIYNDKLYFYRNGVPRELLTASLKFGPFNVSTSDWIEATPPSDFTGYGFYYDLNCPGVTSVMVGDVIVAPRDSLSGKIATSAETKTNCVRIYASERLNCKVLQVEARN